MMIKKSNGVIVGVLLLCGILLIGKTSAYSDELQAAYAYAHDINITTQSSIDSANMMGTLIRAHMAKMMVNYATQVLGKTPNTSLACTFTDIADQSQELQGYITQACQLGLMGQGITTFDPAGIVTRAQFGTVLSRALYGARYNGGTPYYANHLLALKVAGVMKSITIPSAPEVRGYVMLMMQRADEGTGNSNNNSTGSVNTGNSNTGIIYTGSCTTPANLLACSLGLVTCPVGCATGNVTTGSNNTGSNNTGYSLDMQNAYVYAYQHGFTAVSSIASANISGTVQRGYLAQMIAIYATDILHRIPNTSGACEFTDLVGQPMSMVDFAITSCQLGLMGVGTGIFNPYAAVTKGEFAIILSHLLYGTVYDGSIPEYDGHLNGLSAAGILTDISNPLDNVTRGYVRLAFKKANN